MKLDKNLKLLAVLLISITVLISESSSISLRKVESDSTVDSTRHKTVHKSVAKAGATGTAAKAAVKTAVAAVAAKTASNTIAKKADPAPAPAVRVIPAPTFNATNVTLSGIMYENLNQTYVKQDIPTFKSSVRKWNDLKLFDKQLDDIYQDMIYKQNKDLSPEAAKASIQIFARQFEACDGNGDNVLNQTEFTKCFVNDTYLNSVQPTHARFATFSNYSFTNSTGFYPLLFSVMDTYNLNYTNFHDYMMLRLMAFSWRKCSVSAPFIEEVSFECAIEIAFGSKSISRNTNRHLFKLALELSNSQSVRNLDFISYFIVAQSVRLFGKINNKEDGDATKAEMNLALDTNMLPSRYCQEVIDMFFQLVEEEKNVNHGMDLLSFVFYDFVLRIFEVPNAAKKWKLNNVEFKNLFSHYLFPATTLEEVQMIPQNNLTNESYQMYTYMNISQYHQEADHFLKFAQKSEKTVKSLKTLKAHTENKKHRLGNARKLPGDMVFDIVATSNWLFNILDHDADGVLSFYEYANFMQISYLFSRFDQYRKGRVVAGNLYEKYTTYADFPYVSSQLRQRGQRFNLLSQDLYMDLMRTTLVLRIDDLINANKRRLDPTTLYEIELKHIFSVVNLGGVPDAILNKCLRGVDDNNVPKYEWECAFVNSITITSNYLESSDSYLTAKSAKLNLLNTAFVNVDPQLKQAPKAAATE
jgi:hypothetical protein